MSDRQLRILTLNIAHGRGLSTYQGFHGARCIERNLLRIARLLQREGADIVAMQEVDEDSHSDRDPACEAGKIDETFQAILKLAQEEVVGTSANVLVCLCSFNYILIVCPL